MYMGGDGVPKDVNKAIEFYRKAVDRGDPYAKLALSSLYEKGEGVAKDEFEAFRLALEAAHAGMICFVFSRSQTQLSCPSGIAMAQHNIGCYFRQGFGADKNYVKAAHYFSLAADQGVPHSMVCLLS